MQRYRHKQKEIIRKKGAILRVARSIFIKKGIANTTMEEIAQKAGVSKGSIYLYFMNKEDVFWGVVYLALDKLYRYLTKEIRNIMSPVHKLSTLGLMYFQFSTKFPVEFEYISHFVIKSENLKGMAVKCLELGLTLMKEVENILVEGQTTGVFKSDFSPDRMAFLLWGEITGVIQLIQKLQINRTILPFSPDQLLVEHLHYQLKRIAVDEQEIHQILSDNR